MTDTVDGVPMRRCTTCGIERPATLEHFPAHASCKYGLSSKCRSCTNAYGRAWKAENSERLTARRRVDYAERYGERNRENERRRAELYPLRVQAENMLSGIRDRSRAAGFDRPPELTNKSFFIDWMTRQPECPCCGTAFSIGKKQGERVDSSPSVDRFDNSRGYDLDNIELICWRCNNIKRNYSAADLRMVADWMDRRSANDNGALRDAA